MTFHESKRKRSLSNCVLYFLLHWFYYCQESLASRLGITSQLPFPSLFFQDWKKMFRAGMEGWGQKPKAISFLHSCTLPWVCYPVCSERKDLYMHCLGQNLKKIQAHKSKREIGTIFPDLNPLQVVRSNPNIQIHPKYTNPFLLDQSIRIVSFQSIQILSCPIIHDPVGEVICLQFQPHALLSQI